MYCVTGPPCMYTVSQNKTFDHSFGKRTPIIKIISMSDSNETDNAQIIETSVSPQPRSNNIFTRKK